MQWWMHISQAAHFNEYNGDDVRWNGLQKSQSEEDEWRAWNKKHPTLADNQEKKKMKEKFV